MPKWVLTSMPGMWIFKLMPRWEHRQQPPELCFEDVLKEHILFLNFPVIFCGVYYFSRIWDKLCNLSYLLIRFSSFFLTSYKLRKTLTRTFTLPANIKIRDSQCLIPDCWLPISDSQYPTATFDSRLLTLDMWPRTSNHNSWLPTADPWHLSPDRWAWVWTTKYWPPTSDPNFWARTLTPTSDFKLLTSNFWLRILTSDFKWPWNIDWISDLRLLTCDY